MKTVDFAIKKTAQDLDLPLEDVKSIMYTYWADIFSRIQKGTTTTIDVKKIGLFTMSRRKLNEFIQELIDSIRDFRKLESIDDDERVVWIANKMVLLKRALIHRNQVAINYATYFGNI